MQKTNAQMQKEWRERQGGKVIRINEESLATLRQVMAVMNGQVPKELRGEISIKERNALQLLIHIGSFAFKPGFAMVQLDELLKGISELVAAHAGDPTAEEINDTIAEHTVVGMSPWPAREDA